MSREPRPLSARLFGELELRLGDELLPRLESARARSLLAFLLLTTQLATLEPPPPEMQQLLGAMYGNTSAMDDFVSVSAGTLSPIAFFDPGNIGNIRQQCQSVASLSPGQRESRTDSPFAVTKATVADTVPVAPVRAPPALAGASLLERKLQ
jgi:hypothetical protein